VRQEQLEKQIEDRIQKMSKDEQQKFLEDGRFSFWSCLLGCLVAQPLKYSLTFKKEVSGQSKKTSSAEMRSGRKNKSINWIECGKNVSIIPKPVKLLTASFTSHK